MAELPDFAVKLLDKVAVENGFSNYRLESEAGSQHGDGFVGLMISVKIVGDCVVAGTKSNETMKVLCKLAPTHPDRRKEFHASIVFDREVHAYNRVLPYFIEFQREKGLSVDEGFNAYAKCYAADNKEFQEILIMEDLRTRGYVLLPKDQPCVVDNSRLVFEQLAKFHAISFALKDQRPDYYKRELRPLRDIFMEFFRNGNSKQLFLSSYQRALEVLDDPKQLAIVQEMHDNLIESFEKCIGDGVAEPYDAVSHGDCWNNNMLFKFKQVYISHSIINQILSNYKFCPHRTAQWRVFASSIGNC